MSTHGIRHFLDLIDIPRKQLREMIETSRVIKKGRRRVGKGPLAGKTFNREVTARKKAVRAWADKHGIRARKGPDRPAYVTTTGKYYYPGWLYEAYDQHLGQEGR